MKPPRLLGKLLHSIAKSRVKYGCLVCACLLMTGCASTQITVSYVKPGAFNLQDVSKIAVVDFNSLPDDYNGGIAAADPQTVALVQRLVGAAFQAQKLYEVVELGAEPKLQSLRQTIASRRYDGIMYGRVWWQENPELRGQYPAVIRMQSWRNLYRLNAIGQEFLWCKKLSREQDVMVWPTYRSKNATLMLALVIFKLDANGNLKKVTDTFACADADFLVNNGDFQFRFLGDVSQPENEEKNLTRQAGFFTEAQHTEASCFHWQGVERTVGIPNDAQIKLMLANRLTAAVAAKLIPTEQTFTLQADFSDDKLDAMLRAGAYEGARAYAVQCLERGLSTDQRQRVLPLAGYAVKNPEGPTGKEFNLKGYVNGREDYLFALALCEEHAGQWKRAHYTYAFLFAYCPSQRAADGMGRCAQILKASEELDWNVIGNIQESRRKADLK